MTMRTVPLTDEAIDYVLANLCAEDRAELAASGIAEPRAMFQRAAREAGMSGAVLTAEAAPCAIWGANPRGDGTAIVWMVGTDAFARSGRPGAALSLTVVGQMLLRFRKLENWVHVKHRRAVRWLAWLGFEIDPQPRGPGGEFRYFSMVRSDV